MKTLVIGANGFLGRNLVKKCLEWNWRVDCVYHEEKKFIPDQCQTFHINDLEKITEFYEVVFLLSAFIPENKSALIPDKRLLDVNVGIPLRVVNIFKKSKIIFSSSASIYGTHAEVILENSSFNNPDSYALSKLSAEFILRFSTNCQIVRFSSIYGVGMRPTTFIPKLIKGAKKNKKLTLFGDGSRLQNYIYVEDAVGYLMSTVDQKKSGIYLGVFNKSYSNKDVAETIKKYIPDCKIEYLREDNSPSFEYNNASTRKQLGFEPKYSLDEGIVRMLKYG